jgi:heat-inducible transcriptional repressor
LQELTERQEHLLGLVVREYVTTPNPVSSKTLVEKYGLKVSSATVRNDLVTLENLGYLSQPHTSAGRIPTEAGYRYFVQRLIGEAELPLSEQRRIRHQFHQARLDLEQWMRLAASVLARSAHSAALVTSPHVPITRLKHVQLVSTQGRVVLMIVVLNGGDLRQQMLKLAEPVPQETLTQVSNHINDLCVGLTADQIRVQAIRMPLLDREISELIGDIMTRADQRHKILIRDGLTNVLGGADEEGARQALRILEQRDILEEILAEALAPGVKGVQVMIAGEGRWEELSQCSMVLSRYGVTGQATGALGVLGPTRLRYGRAISTVRYMAGLMSDLVIDLYGGAEGQSTV